MDPNIHKPESQKLVNNSNVHHITPIPEAPVGAIIAFSIEEK